MDIKLINEIQECLLDIDEDINYLVNQRDFLESLDFETLKPTEEIWHKLMETNIRNNQIITNKMVTNLYPDATNFKLGCNYVFFTLQGINIGIATSRCRECLILENKNDKGKTFYNLSEDEINNIKEVVDRLSQFSNNVKLLHYTYYYKTNGRVDISEKHLDIDKFYSLIEEHKIQNEKSNSYNDYEDRDNMNYDINF